jgi:hypothetical protein
VEPRVPDDWTEWSVDWRTGRSTWHIRFQRAPGASAIDAVEVDGVVQPGATIELRDDGATHAVNVRFAPAASHVAAPRAAQHAPPRPLPST